MDLELILERLALLPENLQFQVAEYIDFLLLNMEQEEPISAEIRALLDERIANHEKNPDNVKSWEEIEARLLKKSNYAV